MKYKLAHEIAIAGGGEHDFDPASKQAGKYWLQLFMKQNPVINLRKHEPVTADYRRRKPLS
jgi:hypothetical protein